MVNGQSDIGVAAQASPQAAAYQALLDQLERVLPPQDFTEATEAYEEYADAYAEAVSDPRVRQRVASASQRLGDVLNQVLEDSQVRDMVHEATAEYLRLVGEAWPGLTTEDPDSETFAAVATGMTTLAYLYGLGSNGFADHWGAASPFAPATLEGSWSRRAGSSWAEKTDGNSLWGIPAGTDQAEDAEESAMPEDDGIVWQEFSVGDDGQIVQRAAPSRASKDRPDGSRPVRSPAAVPRHGGGEDGAQASARKAGSVGRARARETEAGEDTTPGDPVRIVEQAYATYVEGLRLAGARLPEPSDGLAPPPRADETPPGGPQSELDRQAAELISAYLRLAHGIGYTADPYLSYFRLLATVTELAERQLALVHTYEQLLQRAAQAKPAGNIKRVADTQYQRFLAAVRTAWSQVDPSSLRPEQLSAMTASTARAASLYQAAIKMNGPPLP